jgi:hypothetical protein
MSIKPITKGYVVEVCTKIGRDETGDFCYDLCQYDEHEVCTLDEARKLARQLLPQDQFGEVGLMPFKRDKFGQISYDYEQREIIG